MANALVFYMSIKTVPATRVPGKLPDLRRRLRGSHCVGLYRSGRLDLTGMSQPLEHEVYQYDDISGGDRS